MQGECCSLPNHSSTSNFSSSRACGEESMQAYHSRREGLSFTFQANAAAWRSCLLSRWFKGVQKRGKKKCQPHPLLFSAQTARFRGLDARQRSSAEQRPGSCELQELAARPTSLIIYIFFLQCFSQLGQGPVCFGNLSSK